MPAFFTTVRGATICLLATCALLSGCERGSDKPVVVDMIGKQEELARPQPGNVSIVSRTFLGATAQGLLSFDARGEIVGGVAESWIVTDDGQSYIFRLKQLNWSDGKPVRADEVAKLLQARLKAAPDLWGGLQPEVRAMTDRVIEIRIDTAVPSFIQLLASQRLPLLKAAPFVGSGPYGANIRLQRAYLAPLPDGLGSESADASPERDINRRTLEVARASLAITRFQRGQTDLVLGGRYQDLPLLGIARLREANVRADPVSGLFGLSLSGNSPLLKDAAVRAAINSAIDRSAIASAFNVTGWTITEHPLPAQLDLASPPTAPVWSGQDIAQRRAAARAAIAEWVSRNGDAPVLRIALPSGSGSRLLYRRIASDLADIGLSLKFQSDARGADLILVDEVAPFDSAHWYIDRLACKSGPGCDPEALTRLADARGAGDPASQARLMSEAEALIVGQDNFIPLGTPIRWSLVTRRLTGFQPSPRGVHPLNQLLPVPN